jgi:KH domain
VCSQRDIACNYVKLRLTLTFMLTVNRLKSELGVDIRIPSDADHSSVIRIEGSSDGIEKAKAELLELVEKVVSFHRTCNHCSLT